MVTQSNRINTLALIAALLIQCTSSNTKSEDTTDTVVTASESSTDIPALTLSQATDEPTDSYIDIDAFTKDPFVNDYPMVKKILRDDGIEFTVIAEDTIHSEYRVIQFDSSRIEFLDSDPAYQDELGDLICSADIRSLKFHFNQGITIGMTQEDFLTRAGIDQSSLTQDQTSGNSYYVHEIPFNEGYWKLTLSFDEKLLIRFQYEISPCYFEYDQ